VQKSSQHRSCVQNAQQSWVYTWKKSTKELQQENESKLLMVKVAKGGYIYPSSHAVIKKGVALAQVAELKEEEKKARSLQWRAKSKEKK
jgi:hypothetical protein